MIKWLLAAAVIWLVWRYVRPPAKTVRPRFTFDEAEARAILGVDRDADADAIRAAHRRLVATVHPDRGGSVELTRRVNAARDRLLKPSV